MSGSSDPLEQLSAELEQALALAGAQARSLGEPRYVFEQGGAFRVAGHPLPVGMPHWRCAPEGEPRQVTADARSTHS